MPVPVPKQAQHQHVSGTKYFNSDLVDDLLDITLNPNYQPDFNHDLDATDSDCSVVKDMSFSLLDCNIQESDGNAILTEFEIEHTPDYAEMCACKAATHAQRFWTSVMNSAAQNNHKITSFFTLAPKQTVGNDNASMRHATAIEHPLSHLSKLQSMLPANFQPATHSDELDSVLPIPEPGAGKVAIVATDFLDVTEDDSDMTESISVIKSIKNLMLNAKKYRSFTALFHLNSLQQIKAPMVKASHTISVSVEKGWYFTHKIHKLY
ncbi:hypothetical protein V8B97DRAFT_2020682 [Scleroderma yunnanense]